MRDRIESLANALDSHSLRQTGFDPVTEVTGILDAIPDRTAFFSALIRTARRSFFSNHEAILSYHSPTRRWFVEAAQDMEDATIEELKGLSRTAIEHSRTSGQSLLVPNVNADALLKDRKSTKEHNIQSVLIAPIFVDDEFWGLIYLANTNIPDAFNDEARVQLEKYATFAGKAITRCEEFVRFNLPPLDTVEAPPALLEKVKSQRMAEVLGILKQAAPREASVLLIGETGTGKDTLARWIHEHSARREQPMVQIDCTTLAANLIEVELFGIESGVATGVSFREGKVKIADGGTLFVNEVGELPLSMQAKILRVIEDRVVERIGGRTTLGVDVRFIFATGRDLAALVQKGEFRRDLYYRMNVFEVHVPPLGERREDIPMLASHILSRNCRKLGLAPMSISDQSLEYLTRRDWPGNIRELANFIEKAMAFSPGEELIVDQGSQRRAAAAKPKRSFAAASLKTAVADFEASYIRHGLEQHGWVEARAARAMGIPEGTLRSKIKKYQIKKPRRVGRGNPRPK